MRQCREILRPKFRYLHRFVIECVAWGIGIGEIKAVNRNNFIARRKDIGARGFIPEWLGQIEEIRFVKIETTGGNDQKWDDAKPYRELLLGTKYG